MVGAPSAAAKTGLAALVIMVLVAASVPVSMADQVRPSPGTRLPPFAMSAQAAVWATGDVGCQTSKGCAYVIGGVNGSSASKDIARLDPVGGAMTVVGQLPVPLFSHAAAFDSVRQHILIFGGATPGTGNVPTIYEYAPGAAAVVGGTAVASLPQAINWVSAAFDPTDTTHCTAGCAYMFAGDVYSVGQTSIIRYDPVTKITTTLPGLFGSPRWGTGAVFDPNERIFLIAGGNGKASSSQPLVYTDEIVEYNPYSGPNGAATVVGRLPTVLADMAAGWDGQSMVIFGGHAASTANNKVLRYTPGQATAAATGATLPEPRSYLSAAFCPTGPGFVFGGNLTHQLLVYDVSANPAAQPPTTMTALLKVNNITLSWPAATNANCGRASYILYQGSTPADKLPANQVCPETTGLSCVGGYTTCTTQSYLLEVRLREANATRVVGDFQATFPTGSRPSCSGGGGPTPSPTPTGTSGSDPPTPPAPAGAAYAPVLTVIGADRARQGDNGTTSFFANDQDSATLRWLITQSPAWAKVDAVNLTVTWDTKHLLPGEHCGPTFVATDEVGGVAMQQFCITVLPLDGPDFDGDGIMDVNDDCQIVADPAQPDADLDGVGDLCETVPAPSPSPSATPNPVVPVVPLAPTPTVPSPTSGKVEPQGLQGSPAPRATAALANQGQARVATGLPTWGWVALAIGAAALAAIAILTLRRKA